MRVRLKELKRLCEILINKAVKSGFEEIEIDADNFWIIASGDRENINIETPNVCVGSLYDDIGYLNKILEGANPPTPVDFDRLASVLIAVGERISRSDRVY